jgi:F-type H+-transporting ATPase subunit gamma
MANTITLKRRITSVKTKAMELVSASKMRRAQERAISSREYSDVAHDLLARLGSSSEVKRHPLFTDRKIKTKLYLLITSNTGLAGAYNYNVLKMFTNSVALDHKNNIKTEVITVGKKGAQFVRRLKDITMTGVYTNFGDSPTANDIRPILDTLMNGFRLEKVDAVDIIYTKFKSNLSQEVIDLGLLPASVAAEEKTEDYITNFEPSVEVVLDNITARLIESQISQALAESIASEHSMRMVAMKNATDNANDLIGDYTLQFNTARQAGITQELAEISGGVEALKD